MRALIRFLALLLFAAPAFAQAPIEPAKLPADTTFYVAWRGMNSQPGAMQANSLLALWNDPDFAPVRAALVQEMLRDRAKGAKEKRLEPADLQEFSALLENPFVFGVVSKPAEQMAGKLPKKTGATPAEGDSVPKWDGSFFIYDATGKEALYQKFLTRMREGDGENPEISKFTVGSIQAEKVARKSGTNHYALAGHFAVSAADRGVFEEVLRRVAGGDSRSPEGSGGPGRALGDSGAFREAQRELLPGSVLELFFQIPDLRDLAPTGVPVQQAQFSALVDGMRLDALHAVCIGLKLDEPATRVHGALLGDPKPGTLFDLWPAGDAPFASLALAPADSVSYSALQVDLIAFYDLLHKSLQSASPPGQAGMVDLVEGMAASRLGMPFREALGLLSGEFASLSTSEDLNFEGDVYAFGITKKLDALKLLRTILSDRITSERNEGDITFLRISLSSKRTSAGLAQWKFYHLAVTPNVILGGMRTDTLRTLLAQAKTGGPQAGLGAAAGFQQVRSRFPQNINSVGYFDFSRVNWAAAKDRWLEQVRKLSGGNADAAKNADALLLLKPEVLSRHLHTMASGSWKDSRGLRFDAWIQ